MDQSFPCRFGKYTLVQRIAAGGMAEVDLAIEEIAQASRRFVIIKRIRHDQAADPDYLDFFRTEGRVALRCTHPNLPQVYELGRVGEVHYIAMEYIHGHTLLDMIRAAILSRRQVSVATVVGVGVSVAAALEHVHSLRDVNGTPLKVIHRDVTPQNIMLTTAGTVKLIDFGIVRSSIQAHHTAAGIVKGKFAYMAPEQLEGRPTLDHRADLFALGIVLWECLTRRPLFRAGTELDTANRVHHLRIPDPVTLRQDTPGELSWVVGKALERDPDSRFQSATEVLSALEDVIENCHLAPTMTRLRQEMVELCGVPRLPAIPTRIAPAQSDEISLPSADELDTDAEDSDPSRDGLPPNSGLARDPLLLYFLRQAGARVPEMPVRIGPKQSKPDA